MLCVRRFEEEEEAVEAANKSDYGLSAAVMSSDLERYGQSTCTVICMPSFFSIKLGGD